MGKAALLGRAKRFIVVSGIRYRLLDVLEKLKQRLPQRKIDPKDESVKKILEKIDKEITEKMAVHYAQAFKKGELNKLIKFYSSPLAKKLRETRPKIMKLTMEIACELLTTASEK